MRLLPLTVVALVEDFFEDAAGTRRITHIDVRACKVELGADFGHRTRFVQVVGHIVRRQGLRHTRCVRIDLRPRLFNGLVVPRLLDGVTLFANLQGCRQVVQVELDIGARNRG